MQESGFISDFPLPQRALCRYVHTHMLMTANTYIGISWQASVKPWSLQYDYDILCKLKRMTALVWPRERFKD